jgi:hypothetical protein
MRAVRVRAGLGGCRDRAVAVPVHPKTVRAYDVGVACDSWSWVRAGSVKIATN